MGKKARETTQRIKILDYLKNVKHTDSDHPNAEDIHREVKKDLPAITLATVYRNLNYLAGQGRILKLDLGKELRFDADVCNHQHLVCENCGRIFDMQQDGVCEHVMKNTKSRDFEPVSVGIVVKGLCIDCKNSR